MLLGLLLWAAVMVAAVTISDLHGSEFFMSIVAAEHAPVDASALSP